MAETLKVLYDKLQQEAADKKVVEAARIFDQGILRYIRATTKTAHPEYSMSELRAMIPGISARELSEAIAQAGLTLPLEDK